MVGVAGVVERVVPPELRGGDSLLTLGLKLPPLLADLGTGWLIWLMVRPRSVRLGLICVALYLFNPAVWYLSAWWGQTDSVWAFFLVLGVFALSRERHVGAWLSLAAGIAVKFTAVVLVPLFVAASLRSGLRPLVMGVLTAAVVAILCFVPFAAVGVLPAYLDSAARLGDT